jgi:iduronate 2-sulfatase
MKNTLPVLLWMLLPALAIMSACKPEKKESKPNILFLSIDDLRPTLGAYGDSIVLTPNIDRLAAEGMTFRQTFCQAAVCAPSRASLMTGLRPDSTRVWHLGDKFREINPETVTMPQYFSRFGYHTVNIGKIFHNYMPDSVSWDEPDLRPARYLQADWLGRDGETFYISEEVNRSQAIKRDHPLGRPRLETGRSQQLGKNDQLQHRSSGTGDHPGAWTGKAGCADFCAYRTGGSIPLPL